MGDQVSLKLQLYVQSSLVKQTNHKLAFNFFGPYPVIAKVGLTAYKLGLPASCNLHPVFHVSPLKKDVGSSCQVSSSLPIFSYHLQWSEAVCNASVFPRQMDLHINFSSNGPRG